MKNHWENRPQSSGRPVQPPRVEAAGEFRSRDGRPGQPPRVEAAGEFRSRDGRSGGERLSRPAPNVRSADGTEVVYGLRAALAVLAVRSEDVLQLVCTGRSAAEVAAELRAAEESGIPCTELSDRELESIAGSPHHEGLVLTTKPRSWASPRQLAEVLVASKGVALALDRVRNPHNVGAILRSAAFFGVDAVILGAMAPGPELASNAIRIAEGGAERLILCRTPDLGETLARMKSRGMAIVGSDAQATHSVVGYRFKRPTILVLGHEHEGMTARVRAQCEALVRIPGAGLVESLNVSVAAGVLISELVRPTA